MIILDLIGLFLFIAGFIIGLGAVTVIDIAGFLGRTSSYWTETTTRIHKITKPMIWCGMFLAVIGGVMFYRSENFSGIPLLHALIAIILIGNGYFLSFKVSPFLLQRERDGQAGNLLPASWQRKIIFSLIISDIGWWSALLLFVIYLVNK